MEFKPEIISSFQSDAMYSPSISILAVALTYVRPKEWQLEQHAKSQNIINPLHNSPQIPHGDSYSKGDTNISLIIFFVSQNTHYPQNDITLRTNLKPFLPS